MSKTIKILSVILLVTMIFTIGMGTISNASGSGGTVVDELFNESRSHADTDGLQGVGANIVNIITTVGIIVAVVVLLVLGIKYMMGSAAEKAEYKKTMIPYLVGAVLIFGAAAIAKAIIAMSQSITASS